MAEENQSSGYCIGSAIGSAIGSDLPASDMADRADSGDTKAESRRWTGNTLPGIEAMRAGANDDTVLEEARLQIQRLQQTLIEFEAEHARLAAKYQNELAARNAELETLQAAYEEFEQQSDLLLSELDQQNERLRAECRASNSRSIL